MDVDYRGVSTREEMPREAGEDSGAQPRARRDAPGGFGRGPRISLLAIFWHQYCKLVRGPFRTVKAAVLGACAAVLLILGAALIVPGLTQVALLSAAASLVLLLTLVVLLISRLIARLTDVQALFSLECGLARSGYVLDDFYTDGAAANPSLQLLLLKCLRFSRPQRILELGSGQTTKLLTCYQKANPDSHVITLEQDADWARRMRALIPQEAQGHDYRYRPLEKRVFLDPRSCRPIHSLWYRDVADLRARRFGLILVDGPDHGAKGTEFTPYSRSGILEYIPGILDDSWILVFDDAERYGEIMTTRLCEAILSKHKRPFLRFEVHGEKSQTIFCSPSLGFLATS